MIDDMKVLAVIPARGGSKRLPRKNLLDLGGRPLVAWSIKAGQCSNYVDQIAVTSDDAEILEIAQDYGVLPIDRPAELANDTATTFEAIEHTIRNVEKNDLVVVLQPTSPLRSEKHVDEAIELLVVKNANAVVSVCEMDHSPLWANKLNDDLSMVGFLKDEVANKRSQDLERYYRLNGAIYVCNIEKLLEEKSFFLKKDIFAYKMDRHSSIDIDEKDDFLLAQYIFEKYT
jgi:CMP-N-acetylneuraminic acid synthetase